MRLALLLAAALALPAAAQAPPWTAAARQSATAFDDARAAWLETEVGVERRVARGALAVGVGRAERFGRAAAYGALDVYHAVAPRVYGNVRLRAAPGATTVAQYDVLAELYAAVPGGAEVSGGARRIGYADGGATLLLASATAFRRAGRVRARLALTPTDSATAVSAGLALRLDRSPEPATTSFVQLRGGRAQEVVAEPGGPVAVRTSWDLGLGGRVRLGRRAALEAAAGRTWGGGLDGFTGDVRLAVRF